MSYLKYCLAFASGFLFSALARAQDTLGTRVTYDLSTEMAIGTGDYTAFQLAANRHHVLSTRPNTGYTRGAINLEHSLGRKLTLSGTVDAIASFRANHKLYLQQCYVRLSNRSLSLEIGSREEKPLLRDEYLSSGSFVKGMNAKPIPQVQFSTNGFRTVKNTHDWLQVNFGFGYGKFMDSGYRKDMYNNFAANQRCATNVYYHQKHLYFRSNPEKRFFGIIGIEHAVQFGGTCYTTLHNVETVKEKPVNLKAFWNVILPIGDSNYFENEAMEDWVYGNHIGQMTCQVGWNINGHHQVQAYLDDIFEDGSGIRKSNGWDGLWGLQYKNRAPGRKYVRGAVLEFFQTTNQSGPLHWDDENYPNYVRNQMKDFVTGNDNYYNHGFYDSFSHYGMTPGNPLVISPKYNKDGSSSFRDNRLLAWHVGVMGEITDQLSYLVKGAYREGWGTYIHPLPDKHYSFNAMFQGIYCLGPWQFGAAFAFDKGNVCGNCTTLDFKIGYHGKLL